MGEIFNLEGSSDVVDQVPAKKYDQSIDDYVEIPDEMRNVTRGEWDDMPGLYAHHWHTGAMYVLSPVTKEVFDSGDAEATGGHPESTVSYDDARLDAVKRDLAYMANEFELPHPGRVTSRRTSYKINDSGEPEEESEERVTENPTQVAVADLRTITDKTGRIDYLRNPQAIWSDDKLARRFSIIGFEYGSPFPGMGGQTLKFTAERLLNVIEYAQEHKLNILVNH